MSKEFLNRDGKDIARLGEKSFFPLKVDCGTEILSSPQRDLKDSRQKILNYK